MSRKLRVLVAIDVNFEPARDYDYRKHFDDADWETTRDVVRALERLGHEVSIAGAYRDVLKLADAIRAEAPDVVFNLVEAIDGDRGHEPSFAGLLAMLGVRYTGVDAAALALCKNKGVAKKILTYHRIRVPRFVVSHRHRPLRSLGRFGYPAFVKAVSQESSAGISKRSLVTNEEDCLERVRFIHERQGEDAMIEEFVDGRELYVAVAGVRRLMVFPPRELFFDNVPAGTPAFATYKAKWDLDYRKRWGIRSGPAGELPEGVARAVADVARRTAAVLQIWGYVRIDLRLTRDNEVVVIEANPNPSLAADEDFAQAAAAGGLAYDPLIQRIVDWAIGQ
jgi:D-alanine-D-alanine ligase